MSDLMRQFLMGAPRMNMVFEGDDGGAGAGGDTGAGGDGGTGDSGNGNAPKWMAQLPDDLKGNEHLTGYSTLGDLGRDVLAMREKLGSAVFKPGEDATAEARAEFMRNLGFEIPEEAGAYKLPVISTEDVPEGLADHINLPDEFAEGYKSKALELGLNATQAAELFAYLGNYNKQSSLDRYNAEVAQRESALEELQGKWGEETKARIEKAHRALEAIAGDELAEKVMGDVDALGLGNDPYWVQVFDNIASKIMDDDVLAVGRGGPVVKRPVDRAGNPIIDFPSMDN